MRQIQHALMASHWTADRAKSAQKQPGNTVSATTGCKTPRTISLISCPLKRPLATPTARNIMTQHNHGTAGWIPHRSIAPSALNSLSCLMLPLVTPPTTSRWNNPKDQPATRFAEVSSQISTGKTPVPSLALPTRHHCQHVPQRTKLKSTTSRKFPLHQT